MIRRATGDDHRWITTTAARVYANLGDYDVVMASWLAQPGVLAWVEVDSADQHRGFALLGFYQEMTSAGVLASVADVLAIAVEPAHQRRGVGTALLDHVIAVAARAGPVQAIGELRLTVADDNLVSQRMYARVGFVVATVDPGPYASGRRAVRMVRPLP